jgi:hypothetical protein
VNENSGAVDRRVAVIAVHGVGSPERFSTARSVADLLVQHPSPGAEYEGFVERGIIIPTSPLAPTSAPSPSPVLPRLRGALSAVRRQLASDRTRLTPSDTDTPAPDIAFMREQLRHYRSERLPYETIELVGTRRDGTGTRTAVHIYEMHWADLSRLGSGVLRILGAAYQLILHVSHLGRKTLDIAWQYAPDPRDQPLNEAWRTYATRHAWAVRLFTIGVPVSSLLMLLCGVLFVPAAIPPGARLVAGTGGVEVLVLTALGVGFFRRSSRRNAASWFLAVAVVVAVAGVVAVVRPPMDAERAGTVLITLALGATALAAVRGLLAAYDRRRPGSLLAGNALLLVVVALTAWKRRLILGSDSADWVRQAAFIAFQWSYVVHMLVWVVLWGCVIAAVASSVRVWRRTPAGPARWRVERAEWTSRVTLMFALFCYIVLALIAYQTLVGVTAAYAPALFPNDWSPRVVAWLAQNAPSSAEEFFSALVAESATSGLPLAIAGAGLAALLVLWFFVLVAITGIRRPNPDSPFGARLGEWVTEGFAWLRRAGDVLAVSIVALFAVGGAVDLYTIVTGSPTDVTGNRLTSISGNIVRGLAYAMLLSGATIAAVRLRLAALASRTRPALGILLDIDNYLRESPNTATPRARMAERFTSLIRHIVNQRDARGRERFDRIVLVAHSQGSVITADLLRYLSLEGIGDPVITADRFRLITMGSPLRQLYAANFPHLYRWVDLTDDVFPSPAGTDLSHRSPFVTPLRVGEWVHLYTTGDYVGRPLWRSEWSPGVWQREPFGGGASGDRRRERCLGAGTHTQYWTSADVAQELDAQLA